jgi:hypothetical protein
VGSALQPPFRNILTKIASSNATMSAGRTRVVARAYFVGAGLFIVLGLIGNIVGHGHTFRNAYPFLMGLFCLCNGFVYLRAARKLDAEKNELRGGHLPSLR